MRRSTTAAAVAASLDGAEALEVRGRQLLRLAAVVERDGAARLDEDVARVRVGVDERTAGKEATI